MNPYVIANTPCGVYKGDLPLGYAYYQSLLDFHSRFLRTFRGLEVICHKYSLNVLGKRAENLGLDGTIENLDRYAKEWIKKGILRDRMNFSFEGNLLDTEQRSIEQIKKVFRALYEKGYILKKGDTFYLDAEKIGKNFDLKGIAQKINFFSDRSRKEFFRVIEGSNSPIRITKDRKYSIPNPFNGEGIAPIFGVSNLWEGCFNQEIDLVAASEKELTRYLALRFLSQIPISEDLPMRNVLVYSYIEPEGGFDSWDVEKLTMNKSGSDALRYSFAKSFSLSRSRTELTNSLVEGGKRLVNLIDNLKRFFLERGLHIVALPDVADDRYFDAMDNFRYSFALSELEIRLKEVSKSIDDSRRNGDLDLKKTILFDKYLALVRKLSPFCPYICDKVITELNVK